MKYLYGIAIACCVSFSGFGQKVVLTPIVTPSLFRAGDQITLTYDVTGTSLASLNDAYLWLWIPDKTINARYNINPANSNPSASENAKFAKSIVEGNTFFTITFTPAEFFDGSIDAETNIGMLLKGNDWSDGQTIDFTTTFWDGSFVINLLAPVKEPLFVTQGQSIEIKAETPVEAVYKVYVNDVLAFESASLSVFAYEYEVSENTGGVIKLTATSESKTEEVTFQFLVSVNSMEATRPSGIIDGINYQADDTKVILSLWAPGKTSVYVRGDFSDWQIKPEYQLKKDGEHFWVEVSGLTPGEEYGFQYLVDESVWIADPYADKILDPDDQYIPSSIYPDLKSFPDEALSNEWYFNRVAVFQTSQAEYAWQVNDFEKPNDDELVIYELLIRDFFNEQNRSYQNLLDTVSYFKRLGVNAIQLLPIMEFNGNDSWGYNPAFMFAPDKAYGPKHALKQFIDECHKQGIAVILDIAMNHQDIPNPYVLMDFDFETGKPMATNKWFNPDAKHPYNVFFDMNHESSYTKAYLDTVNHYWLNEYKVDGFRFDLSKGFTQKNNPDNVIAWGEYDDSRVAILKRMADEIWSHTPTAYIILEHLSENEEEKELAEYRSDEGKGMMLWGNMNHAFNQLTMGYSQDSDISGVNYWNRDWTVPHLVSYMESHDEERLMYRNIEFGNSTNEYTAKNPATSIQRIKAASVLFYAVPGPKMLWQFGEYGYDYSINTCNDGSVNEECRVSAKPVVWNYLDEPRRLDLFNHTSDLIKLHTSYAIFNSGIATVSPANSLIREVQVKNSPYTETPSSTDEMNVQAIANLELHAQAVSVNFPHTGIWYDYYNGGSPVNVTSLPYQLNLSAGGFKLFTDVSIGAGPITVIVSENSFTKVLYPNPTKGKFKLMNQTDTGYVVIDMRGISHDLKQDGEFYDISHLPAGLYMIMFRSNEGVINSKRIVKY